MNWNEIVNKVTPHVVKIETPGGHGTGFVCLLNDTKTFVGIATANHVVAHADAWQEPIRIVHQASGKVAFLKEEERLIYTDPKRDSAVVLAHVSHFEFPQPLIQLRPIDDRLPIGVEVGWLGYPAVTTHTLCFFSGNISAYLEGRHAYLVDGVAINGVSGGPVIYSTPTDGVQFVGSITAYMANRATGETLPGLSVAQDVSHLHDVVLNMKSLDEARRLRAEEEARLANAEAKDTQPAAEAPAETPGAREA